MSKIEIKWMSVNHYDDALEIERETFGEQANTREDFVNVLSGRDTLGMIALEKGTLVGYVIFQQGHTYTWILSLVVSIDSRRSGIGTLLINRVKLKMHTMHSQGIRATVCEKLLGSHLFLSSHGFVATGVIKDGCDVGCDQFTFAFHKEWDK
jgi:predicted N-acetyltransferase YhbS